MQNTVCSQGTTLSIQSKLHKICSYGELIILVEWKQEKELTVTMETASTEAMPGHCVTSIFSPQILETIRQSFQCSVHLRQKPKDAACRKRDREFEPSGLRCEVLKLVQP